MLKDKALMHSFGNGKFVPYNSRLSNIKEGDTLSLKRIVGNRPKLIFWFTNNHCTDCIHQELDKIEKLKSKLGDDNILVIANFHNERDLRVLALKYDLMSSFYKEIDPLKTSDIVDYPHLFTLDQKLQVENFFVPSKEFPTLSDEYYLGIIEKVF